MSLSEDLSRIICDGEACLSMARAPVALRPLLPKPQGEQTDNTPSAQGWLFVSDEEQRQRHYCPRCTPQFLRRLRLPEPRNNAQNGIYRSVDL